MTLSRHSKNMYSEKEVKEMIDQAVDRALDNREDDAENATGNRGLDRAARALENLAESLGETVGRESGGRGGGGALGGIGEIATTFQRLQLGPAGTAAITQLQPYAMLSNTNLPKGTDGNVIGGPNYDPVSDTSSNNARLLKFAINGLANISRGALMFFMVMVALVKWETLDLLLSGDLFGGSGGGGFDIEELLFFQVIAAGGAGAGLGGLESLFQSFGLFGNPQSALPTTPVYPVV